MADFHGSNLTNTVLTELNLSKADLSGCTVYGASAWDLDLHDASETDLVITKPMEPVIRIDGIEVAQFIHLLIHNEKIRHVIDTITSKVVLILGRFTPERKVILDSLREELSAHEYVPVMFDFSKPRSRGMTETVSTLAHMSKFIIADISSPRSVPQELQAIVPNLPSVPVQPIIAAADYEYGMFEDFKFYPWVLEVYSYKDVKELIASINERVIAPAEARIHGGK